MPWSRRRRGNSDSEREVRYQLADVQLHHLDIGKLPKEIRRLRKALPAHMHHSPPPGNARRGSWFVVARSDGRVIGYAWAVVFAGSSDAAYIEEVVVEPERRGEGVGSQLLREMACHLLDAGRPELSIYPLGGSGWVRRAGFHEFGDGRTFVADAAAICVDTKQGAKSE
jgi:GNAT superfamily N-acetyltransferase